MLNKNFTARRILKLFLHFPGFGEPLPAGTLVEDAAVASSV